MTPPHPLTNFEIQEYYQNEPRFNGFFRRDNLPNRIKKIIGNNKKIIINIYRIQAYDSIMCVYFCIGFINFMFNSNSLTDYTYLFSPNDFTKNDDIILLSILAYRM